MTMRALSDNDTNTIRKRPPLPTLPSNSFLPEPFPTASAANSTRHWHDAFGMDDAGVDYGPPNGYEEDDEDGDDDEEELRDDNENCAGGDGGEGDGVEEESSRSAGAGALGYFLNPIADEDLTGSNATANNNIITIEELEEEVDLHARTLESISIKLQTLDEEIQKEEETSSSLRNDIQVLNQRKLQLKKRKEKSRKLIEELEGSLQKCVERLGIISSGDDDDEYAHDDDYSDDDDKNDGVPGEVPSAVDNDDDTSFTSNDENRNQNNVECDHVDPVCQGTAENLISSIPDHEIRGKIAWPSSELVHNIHVAAEELPVDFPTWRTNALSMSLLKGIDSETILVNVMNVAALENLVKLEEQRLQSSETRSHHIERGGGWVNEADVWGTCLDVYTHVNWKSLFSGFRRVDNSICVEQEVEWQSSATSKLSTRIDPNITICPYELGGTCADGQCSYQHLRRINNRKQTASLRGGLQGDCIRYNNFPKLKLPRLFTREDFIFVEREATSVNKRVVASPSHAVEHRVMNEGLGDRNAGPLNSCGVCRRQEEQIDSQRYYYSVIVDPKDSNEFRTNCTAMNEPVAFRGEDIERDLCEDSDARNVPHSGSDEGDFGLDFIALPTTIERTERYNDDDNYINDCNGVIFNGRFWWQQVGISLSPNVECSDPFDYMLLSFGFARDGNGNACHSLRYIVPQLSSESQLLRQDRIDVILHLSRLIDLSRVLVHMGRDSSALSAMNEYSQSRSHDTLNELVERASCSIKSLSVNRCALSVFEVQVNLLNISEALHFLYDGTFDGGRLCSDELIDQMRLSSLIDDTVETVPIPGGFETLLVTVRLCIPSSNHGNIDGYDDWNSFIMALRSIMENLVMNLSQMGGDDQLTGLYQSTCIGKILSRLIGVAARSQSFVPFLHVIEPIWGSLQPLLQSISGCKKWLHPDIIVIVIIGPILFECVAYAIAPPRACARSQKLSLAFDARAFANVSSLDKCMIGILKELNRVGTHGDGRLLHEILLSPLHALSTTICIAQGLIEKANARLEHLLIDDTFSKDKKRPTVYALSEMIWSQVVQLRMHCTQSDVSLNYVGALPGAFNNESLLPDAILTFHCEIASRIIRNGLRLWGVTLRGDTHMNIISPCFNREHCKEWEKVAAQIFIEHDQVDSELSTLEFHLPNPYSELIGVKSRIAVFPESLFLFANRLIALNVQNCALIRLPSSIGYQIANLQVSGSRVYRLFLYFCGQDPSASVLYHFGNEKGAEHFIQSLVETPSINNEHDKPRRTRRLIQQTENISRTH